MFLQVRLFVGEAAGASAWWGKPPACPGPCRQWQSRRRCLAWVALPEPRYSTGGRSRGKSGTSREAQLSTQPDHGTSSVHLVTEGGSPVGMQLGSIASSLRIPEGPTRAAPAATLPQGFQLSISAV